MTKGAKNDNNPIKSHYMYRSFADFTVLINSLVIIFARFPEVIPV